MLEVKSVSKSLGDRTILDEVSFSADAGRITGLVGARGAGKTTALRIVLGLMDADDGSVELDGEELEGGDRQNFGYLPEERGLYPSMPVGEQLVYFARLHGMSLGAAEKNAITLLERFDISDRAYSLLEQLTASEAQRVQIAAALAHDPDVVVLDEPFRDLDDEGIQLVFKFLADHAASGVPILIASDRWDQVEKFADDVVVLSRGKVHDSGSTDALRNRDGQQFELELSSDTGWIHDIEGIEVLEQAERRAIFSTNEKTKAQDVLRRAVETGDVRKFSSVSPALAEVFREVV
ncbi:ATP-binding cassette domain-containing protein [Saxibacter everestensis]|uniref:ATP-binding cassette domain-containing protein n=1 Tax=Saxibacter everestensis TaxID=2909229 RepID=A0ABY8QV07_9MICO|nr:ATP-binding cassette domain-containing protein [Brevibacteriaceae bacterium ZFBP1038]